MIGTSGNADEYKHRADGLAKNAPRNETPRLVSIDS